jgi:hypothetical protein
VAYPNLLTFNIEDNIKLKQYSNWIYFLFILFYIFLCIIINSELFINFVKKYDNDVIKQCYSFMDGSRGISRSSNPFGRGNSNSLYSINKIETGNNNRILAPENINRDNIIISGNNNQITEEPRAGNVNTTISSLTINNHNNLQVPVINVRAPSIAESIIDGIENNRASQSQNNLLPQEPQFNVNRLRKIKSTIDLKINKLFKPSAPKLTSKDFPFNDNNIFRIPNHIYNLILRSINDLNDYLYRNNNMDLLPYPDVLTMLDSMRYDIKLFSTLQDNLIDYSTDFDLIYSNQKKAIQLLLLDAHIKLNYSNIEEYKNIFNERLNEELKRFLNGPFYLNDISMSRFTPTKLKEFYVINDLPYLNAKNINSIIEIPLFKNFYIFKEYMDDNVRYLAQDPLLYSKWYNIKTKYELINTLFENMYYSAYDQHTINNIDFKYIQNKNIIKVNQLTKTRIVAYYSYLFPRSDSY